MLNTRFFHFYLPAKNSILGEKSASLICSQSFKKCTVVFFVLALFSACNARTIPAPVFDLNSSVTLSKSSTKNIKSATYKVKKGETLYSIAWRANVDVNTLAKLNKIRAPYNIYPGQKILIAQKSTQPKVDKGVVKSAETKSEKSSKKGIAPTKKQEYGQIPSSKKIDLNHNVRLWKWPASGKVIAYYSSKKLGNKGIDIAGKRGEPVKAAANGQVVYVGNALKGYGNLVIVKHSNDYLSAYAHNDIINVKEGQTVKAGQTIAKMGDSGAQRTMLHFEVRFRGKSVNPLKFLPKKQ